MPRYLDPKNDLTFKRIFGEHPDLLISFLNALMPLSEDQLIEHIEYLSPEQVPENPLKKNSIVDVKCVDNFGRQFIVEMQMFWSEGFKNRILFNSAKSYVRQLNRNESFRGLQVVYGLGILNDTFDRETDVFYHHYTINDQYVKSDKIDGLEFVIIELPKFKPEKWADRKMAVLWLRFLKEVKNQTEIIDNELLDNSDISKALSICEESAFTNNELMIYDQYWDYIRTEKTLLEDALDAGLQKGIERGIEKGKAEETKPIVINSKNAGLSNEQIQSITGLSIDDIINILKDKWQTNN